MIDRNRVRALLFDLDGVLLSTDVFHFTAWKGIAERLGIPFGEAENRNLRGVGRAESLEIILHGYHGKSLTDEEKRNLTEEKNAIYRRLLNSLTPSSIPPETHETLRQLRRCGYLLAVASSSRNAGFILEKTDLVPLFDAVIDGTRIEKSKPDPEVFLTAASALGVTPAECAVIEDAEAGLIAAKRAGMTAIGCGSGKDLADAEIGIAGVHELLHLFPQKDREKQEIE